MVKLTGKDFSYLPPGWQRSQKEQQEKKKNPALEIAFGGVHECELGCAVGIWGEKKMSKLHFPASLAAR